VTQPAPSASRTSRAIRDTAPWRIALSDSTARACAGGEVELPATVGDQVTELALRAKLSSDGARAMALLYGAWILGNPAVPLIQLARAIAWDELAGSGSLPRAGLTSVEDGRVRLRSVVARYLDGAPATRLMVHGNAEDVRPDVPPGRQIALVSPDLPALDSARGLAERMGAAAIVDELHARGRDELVAALDEAWLRRLPLIAVPGHELDVGLLAGVPLRPDHALVIVWPDAIVPSALEALSRLEP
jgi:hypothetical protein